MGGDGGPLLTVPASLCALGKTPALHLVLVGDEEGIAPQLAAADSRLARRCSVQHAEQFISDADKPEKVLRQARRSSMYQAVELVKSGSVQAMVSAGNTGALLMIGRHLLKTIPGIQKPAIVATLPGATRQTFLLDVGANPECDAQQLFEFAVMGSVLAESLHASPVKVGLLNIGAEHYKGTDEVRAAAALMEDCAALDYVGFVEANELFTGIADVVVCDGFVGNVTIKSSAGVANVVNQLLVDELGKDRVAPAATALPSVAQRLAEKINPQRFNGASLLGLQGSIIKSHGNATAEGFTYAIRQAVLEAENKVPQLIAKKVAAIIAAS